ncbi:MAG TPA: hypothetical protein VMT05_13040 [Terriglobales bacterium]|jgi:hypothetical protein|nr:hypothetical protein [Terriglobales bacterium]
MMKILVIVLLLWVAVVWLSVLTGIEERDDERVIEERIRRDKFHARPDEQDTQEVHKIIRF